MRAWRTHAPSPWTSSFHMIGKHRQHSLRQFFLLLLHRCCSTAGIEVLEGDTCSDEHLDCRWVSKEIQVTWIAGEYPGKISATLANFDRFISCDADYCDQESWCRWRGETCKGENTLQVLWWSIRQWTDVKLPCMSAWCRMWGMRICELKVEYRPIICHLIWNQLAIGVSLSLKFVTRCLRCWWMWMLVA